MRRKLPTLWKWIAFLNSTANYWETSHQHLVFWPRKNKKLLIIWERFSRQLKWERGRVFAKRFPPRHRAFLCFLNEKQLEMNTNIITLKMISRWNLLFHCSGLKDGCKSKLLTMKEKLFRKNFSEIYLVGDSRRLTLANAKGLHTTLSTSVVD